VAAAGTNATDKQVAEAARKAAQDAINPGFFFLIFWGFYERQRVGDLAYDWAIACAAGHKDYIECKNAPAFNPKSDQWTVELWFKADKTSEENILYNKEQLFEAQVHDGFFEYAWQPSWKWRKTFSVAKGRWYHVAVVYDGKTQKVYRNGQFFSQLNQTGKINSNTFPFLIGARYVGTIRNGVSRHFKGAIDEVRVWNQARTPDQILNNVHKRLRGNEEYLQGYWHFEEDLARDFTANENHGLIKGSPATVESTMPGYAVTAGIGSKIQGTFSETYIQSKGTIPFFDWNHLAAVYQASYGLRFSEQDAFVDCGDSASLDLAGDLTLEFFCCGLTT